MAVAKKSMELMAFGALGAWGSHRVMAWLHQPPAASDRVTMVLAASGARVFRKG